MTVEEMAKYACDLWEGSKGVEIHVDPLAVHEAGLLWLSSELAGKELDWCNRFEAREAIAWTLDWEKAAMTTSALSALDLQIHEFYGVKQ